jgi:RNA polymerase sigma-70 factor (ECF subfamily)
MDAGHLYRQHAAAVLGYLRGQGVPEPEDVLSEVFLQVARALPRFQGPDDELRPWLFTIARNRAIDDRRHRRRRPVLAEAPEAHGRELSGAGDPAPFDPVLVAALARLTPDQREVVVLRFVADLSLDDVAQITGRPAGAVKSMQHRALAQLARILDDPAGAVDGDG